MPLNTSVNTARQRDGLLLRKVSHAFCKALSLTESSNVTITLLEVLAALVGIVRGRICQSGCGGCRCRSTDGAARTKRATTKVCKYYLYHLSEAGDQLASTAMQQNKKKTATRAPRRAHRPPLSAPADNAMTSGTTQNSKDRIYIIKDHHRYTWFLPRLP